jgi:hypothetical protein
MWITPDAIIICERPVEVEIDDGRLVGLTWRTDDGYLGIEAERDALAERVAELEAIVEQIRPPNDVGDDCTAELAVRCAELEREVAARDAVIDELRAQLPATARDGGEDE